MRFFIAIGRVGTIAIIVMMACLVSLSVSAAIPKQQISERFRSEYKDLSTPQGWKSFLQKNTEHFPLDAESLKGSVIVVKDQIEIEGDKFVFGTAYRQIKLASSLARIKEILQRPDVFKELFSLDEEAHPSVNPLNLPLNFTARIKKHLPIVPDQNYDLQYTLKDMGDFVFQTVEQVQDVEDFAIRETLVVLQKEADGVIFREVGRVMPLSWTMRALGAQLRQITKSELTKINTALKCLAESSKPISDKLAADCAG